MSQRLFQTIASKNTGVSRLSGPRGWAFFPGGIGHQYVPLLPLLPITDDKSWVRAVERLGLLPSVQLPLMEITSGAVKLTYWYLNHFCPSWWGGGFMLRQASQEDKHWVLWPGSTQKRLLLSPPLIPKHWLRDFAWEERQAQNRNKNITTNFVPRNWPHLQ